MIICGAASCVIIRGVSESKPIWYSFLKLAGPGLVVAATGIGSGDVVSATVGGARYGVVLLWAIARGRVLQVRAERRHRALAAGDRQDRARGLGGVTCRRG